jgi:antitoxin ParD1/3/4
MATKQRTRNIALTQHFDQFVQAKIESGRYQSASEVVRDSLRIMEEHELERKRAVAEVEKKIRAGYDQLKRGQTVDPDKVYAQIKAMSRKASRSVKKGA